MNDQLLELAQELPSHQTSTGSEFRTIDVPQREKMAMLLTISRVQADASNADWSNQRFRAAMRSKKMDYMYECGRLGIDSGEAKAIWWSVVYEDAAPYRRRTLV